MGKTFFKAVRPDGGSFNDPSFKWATEPGGITTHPAFAKGSDAGGYLSVATVATDCTGMSWPCRLLLVEAAGCRVFTPDAGRLPNKRAGRAFRMVAELPATDVFGPQGVHVAALIARAGTLTGGEATALAAAWYAARDAAWALVVHDLISVEHYDTLTLPWRTTIGTIHPDDAVVTA